MSEFKQFLNFMKWLIPAILFVVGMMAVPEAIESIKKLFKPVETFEARVRSVGLQEAGDFVALVSSNSAVGLWEQSDTWTYEGKEIIAACDYDLEYRYDLKKAKVEVVDADDRNAIRIHLPALKIKCSVNDLRILKVDGGRSVIGTYRIRKDQLNKAFDKARAEAMKSIAKNETNIQMAEQSVRSTLSALFGGAGLSRSQIEFVFDQPPDGKAEIAVQDEKLQRSIEKQSTSGNDDK